jgi:hypothetical protein
MSADRFGSGAEFVACWHALAGKTPESTAAIDLPTQRQHKAFAGILEFS